MCTCKRGTYPVLSSEEQHISTLMRIFEFGGQLSVPLPYLSCLCGNQLVGRLAVSHECGCTLTVSTIIECFICHEENRSEKDKLYCQRLIVQGEAGIYLTQQVSLSMIKFQIGSDNYFNIFILLSNYSSLVNIQESSSGYWTN